ncbi:alpha/beta hydrolase [Sphingomonas sp. S1-29]|uniref:esterase/lipase family protein n=1 Tax=Sphingomonas sp. S1-29 TaxID=2991074 RepID=UPI00223F45CE|nr:alpha/beta fold hydrolase [Sphingomonas sp. S1-29]UZK69136.1 alpha/beta hydrolase [Sphingomonas sp. S1-29]
MVVLGPPSKLRLLTEVPRAVIGVGGLPFARRALMDAPRGDGRRVMLLPGLFNGDRSSLVLRRYLNALGYRAEGWGLGRNFGQRAIGADGERLFAAIEAMGGGEPVTLVGVSLGGIMARIAAHRHPELVREVVTISSPFAGPPSATNVWRVYELLSGVRVDDPEVVAFAALAAEHPPVPTTAIWSASDGFVNGAICRDDRCRSIEVRSSHVWVQHNPQVLRAVAGVLGGDISPPGTSSPPWKGGAGGG